MLKQLLAALVALTFAACGSSVDLSGEDTSSSIEAELKTAAPAARAAPWKAQVTDAIGSAFKTTFEIDATYDLYAALDIPVALTGQHVAAFEFLSPDGVVFQRSEVAFSAGKAKTYRVWSAMPVAGTWIQQFHLAGTWRVQAFLDTETKVRASSSFKLQ